VTCQEKHKKVALYLILRSSIYIEMMSLRFIIQLGGCLHHIDPIELKDTTDTTISVSYLDLCLENDSDGDLRKKLYDKIYNFKFPIVDFPVIYIAISHL